MVDATTQKSVCQSWNCMEVFDGLDKYCPKCGNRAVPQKRLKRLGGVQIASGVVLTAMMAAVSWFTFPLILAERGKPGSELGGSTGLLIMGLFAVLIFFGLGSIAAGYSQLRHGRQNWKIVGVLFGAIVVCCFVGYAAELGLIGG